MLQRKLLYQCQIALALVVRTLSQLLVQRIHLLLQLRHIRERFLRLLTNGGIVLQNHYLRQIAYRRIVGNAHHATGRLLLSTEYLEQGRLACPILTHQGDAVAIVHHKAGIGK